MPPPVEEIGTGPNAPSKIFALLLSSTPFPVSTCSSMLASVGMLLTQIPTGMNLEVLTAKGVALNVIPAVTVAHSSTYRVIGNKKSPSSQR